MKSSCKETRTPGADLLFTDIHESLSSVISIVISFLFLSFFWATFPCYRYKCWHWKSRVSPYIIWSVPGPHAGEILCKPYCPKCTKFWAFWQKSSFLKPFSTKALTPFWKTFLSLKQVFNGKLLIFRLLSFGVPKIRIVRHVKPG